MNFTTTEDDHAVEAAAKETFANIRVRVESGDADRATALSELGRQGWLETAVNTESGTTALIVAEAAGYSLLPISYADHAVAVPAVLTGWERGAAILDAVTNGRQLWSLAGAESLTDGGRGRSHLRLAADGDDRWTVSGTASGVAMPRTADGYLAVARASGDARPRIVAVRAGLGIEVETQHTADETCPTAQVTFTGAPVAVEGELPPESSARLIRWGAAAAAAEILGCCEALLAITTDHARDRRQFGVPIGTFQAVQHHCATMHVLSRALRAAVWAAGIAPSAPVVDVDHVATAKAYAEGAARRVGELAMQVHGGIGFTWEHQVHRYIKRIIRLTYAFGEARWHREQLALRLLGPIGGTP